MNLSELKVWISYLTIPAEALLLLRLVWIGAARRYWCLFAYLLTDLIQTLLALGVSDRSLWYGYVYFGGQTAKTLLAVGVSVQLWLLALHDYPGLARFGRRVALYTLMAALLVAAAGLWLEPPVKQGQEAIPYIFNAFEGASDSMVALFLLLATIFLLWFPVKVANNVASLMGGIVLTLLTLWVGLLLVNFQPTISDAVSIILLCVYLSCLLFWNIAVRRAGESLTTVTGHRWNPEEAERLLNQLDAINARLERAAS